VSVNDDLNTDSHWCLVPPVSVTLPTDVIRNRHWFLVTSVRPYQGRASRHCNVMGFFIHCLKRATVTEGSFYSSDFNSNFSTQVSSHSSYSTWFTNFSTQVFFFVVIFFMMALFLGRVEVSCSNESGGGDEVPSPISISKLLHIYMSLSKE
jgi:hypothetical protein